MKFVNEAYLDEQDKYEKFQMLVRDSASTCVILNKRLIIRNQSIGTMSIDLTDIPRDVVLRTLKDLK